MKKMSFTLFKPGEWLSAFGRSAFLVLFALCCVGMTQSFGQVCALNTDGPLITGSGSGAGISYTTFKECLAPNLSGPTITDPCSCAGTQGRDNTGDPFGDINIFDDQIVITSPNSDDQWIYTGEVAGTQAPFKADDKLVTVIAANTAIPLTGTTTLGGVTLYVYTLDIQHPADVGYTAIVREAQDRYKNVPTDVPGETVDLNELTIGARCFDIDKSVSDFLTVIDQSATQTVGTEAGVTIAGGVNVGDNLTFRFGFPAGATDGFSEKGTYSLKVNGEELPKGSGTYKFSDGNPDDIVLPVEALALCSGKKQEVTLTYTPKVQPTIGYFDVDAYNDALDGIVAPTGAEIAAAIVAAFAELDDAAKQGAGGCPVTCKVDFNVDFCPNNVDGTPGGSDDRGIALFDNGGIGTGTATTPEAIAQRASQIPYKDDKNHRVTICPDDPDDADESNSNKKYIRFIFDPTDFNVSQGDVINIYDGTFGCGGKPASIWTNDGRAISGSLGFPNGGWIDATCANDSGCLTFEFKPKNDGNKGSYAFTYEKKSREAVVTAPKDVFEVGKCDLNGSGLIAANHTIQTLTADCNYKPVLVPTIGGTPCLQVAVRNAAGDIIFTSGSGGINVDYDLNCDGDTGDDGEVAGLFSPLISVSKESDLDLFGEFLDVNGNSLLDQGDIIFLPKGDYTVELFYWDQDPKGQKVSKASYKVFVSGIAPVCNDQVNVDLGTSCAVWLTPDDVLENMCGNETYPVVDAVGAPTGEYALVDGGAGASLVYVLRVDKDLNGKFTDKDDIPMLTTCGLFPYQAITYMDMDGDRVQDDNEPTIGTCWGNVLVENKIVPTIKLDRKTPAEMKADSDAACDKATALKKVADAVAADSLNADRDAALAADILANAQAAAVLYPSNQILQKNLEVAQANLDKVWKAADSIAVAAVKAADAATAAEARCTLLKDRLAATGGVLTACNIEDINEADLFAQIKVNTTGICNLDTLEFKVVSLSGDECSASRSVTVSVTAHRKSEKCGAPATATIDIPVIRPKVVAPANDTLTCGASTEPASTGYPKLDLNGNGKADASEPDVTDSGYSCNFIAEYKDAVFPSCGTEGKKIFRTWTVLDWCANKPVPSVLATQFIEVSDVAAPTFDEGQTDTLTVSVGQFECSADISDLAKPTATNDCSEPTVTLERVARIVDGEMVAIGLTDVSALDVDSFQLRYVAVNTCAPTKRDTLTRIVIVVDDKKPSAVCTDQLHVSIGSGAVKVYAKDVDAGSFDACGLESILIKRAEEDDEDFRNDILFSCEDTHQDVKVMLQVTDSTGNTNVCWMYVTVEDKIAPLCGELDDKSVNCNETHGTDLGESTDTDKDGEMEAGEWVDLTGDELAYWNAEFGDPATVCEDNAGSCQALTTEQQYQLIAEHCGTVRAKRRYRAVDWNGEGNKSAWAEQYVTINYVPGWEVTLPADEEIVCVIDKDGVLPAYGEGDVVISSGSCDQIAVEIETREFVANGDACKKLEITYHVINWCIYVPGTDPVVMTRKVNGSGKVTEDRVVIGNDTLNTDLGYFTYTRLVTLVDNVAPIVQITNPESMCVNGEDCTDIAEWIAWGEDCVAEDDLTWTNILHITDNEGVTTTVKGTGSSIKAQIESKYTYVAEFWAADGCGNSGGAKSDPAKAWDCKKPTPYALNGVAVGIMPTGMVAVWASDLDQGSYDNCSEYVELYIRKSGDDAPAPTTTEEVEALGTSVIFTCEELGTQSVELYAVDEEGNFDFVSTYVIVQDNFLACGDSPVETGQVAGSILDAAGQKVESVEVSINGGMTTSMSTANNGVYEFTLPVGGDYTITAERNDNPLNGVSTYDLVLISKHILGVEALGTPYKQIAADANGSKTISALDLVELRKLILGIETKLERPWRFVDAGHIFGANPLSENFNEFISINDLSGSVADLNFIAIKVGDPSGDARPSSLAAAAPRNAVGTMNLTVTDRFVEAGQEVSVAFTSADMANVSGYQFTMDYAGLELAQLVEGVATAANFNTNLRSAIATSWNGQATSDDVLFTLNFKAITSGNLSDLLSVNSTVIAAEAYNTAGELMDVSINFATSTATVGFGLEQNTPNPFNGETLIGFTLPTAGSATLKVMDVQGRVLKSVTADYAKGFNQVSLNAKELGATGVLHYQLESADNVATKKMIIIE